MSSDWWKNFFAEEYLKIWEGGPITPERTKKEVKFLVDVLKLKKKDKVLDLCCGQGRHTISLVKRGFNVIGVDYSNYLLKVARDRAREEKVKINFIRKDVRNLNFKNRFDIVLNLFTSFGYGSDKDNEKIIKNVAAALKLGGYFLLDLPNVVWLLRNYREDIRRKTKGGTSREENQFDVEGFVNRTKQTLYLKNGRQIKALAHLRHYSFPEIKRLLEDYGLVTKKVWGTYSKDKPSEKTKRLIILSKKITK